MFNETLSRMRIHLASLAFVGVGGVPSEGWASGATEVATGFENPTLVDMSFSESGQSLNELRDALALLRGEAESAKRTLDDIPYFPTRIAMSYLAALNEVLDSALATDISHSQECRRLAAQMAGCRALLQTSDAAPVLAISPAARAFVASRGIDNELRETIALACEHFGEDVYVVVEQFVDQEEEDQAAVTVDVSSCLPLALQRAAYRSWTQAWAQRIPSEKRESFRLLY